MNLLRFQLDQLPFVFLVVMIAFTLHEFAHAYIADKFGDPTPRSMGRVTLNPRVHIDVLGILLIFIAGFGWAKPVMVRSSFFKKPRVMSIIVSLAGPLANLFLVAVGVLMAYLVHKFGLHESWSFGAYRAIAIFVQQMIVLNLILFIFNLLPLPPLDGYRILYEFLPYRLRERMHGYEQWAFFIFLLLVFIPPLYRVTLGPIYSLMTPILYGINSLFALLFGDYGQLDRIFLA